MKNVFLEPWWVLKANKFHLHICCFGIQCPTACRWHCLVVLAAMALWPQAFVVWLVNSHFTPQYFTHWRQLCILKYGNASVCWFFWRPNWPVFGFSKEMNSSMLVVYKAPLFGAELLIPENKAIHMLSIQAICYIVWSLKAENELIIFKAVWQKCFSF